MRITEKLLAAAYDMLRETLPFSRWSLPPAKDLVFKVLRTKVFWGDYKKRDDGKHQIRASFAKHDRLSTLLATVGHEMIHQHLDESGYAKDSSRHGPVFKRLAAQVCKHHPEFDPANF